MTHFGMDLNIWNIQRCIKIQITLQRAYFQHVGYASLLPHWLEPICGKWGEVVHSFDRV